jgi:hypothetical protein
MISPRAVAAATLGVALALGALADRVPAVPIARDDRGRLLLHADLHVHVGFGDGAIPPWNIGREARRRGLHALAVTNHNQVFAARLTRWLSRLWGAAPLVLVGQEVTNPAHHIVAVGINRAVDWDTTAASVIDGVHAAGGLAIAAHPERAFWVSFDAPAMAALDGAERRHSVIFRHPDRLNDLDSFFDRASAHRQRPLAAIGSSDFHTLGTLGRCRTLVRAREVSEVGILQAIADGQTEARCVTPGSGDLPPPFREPALGPSGVLGWLALLGLIVLPGRRHGGGLQRPS